MRWDELFADLEATAAGWDRLDLEAEVAERTRAELGSVTLLSRLHAALGQRVELSVAGAGRMSGTLHAVGADWALLGQPRETLVLTSAVTAWSDLTGEAVDPSSIGVVERRLPVQTALRAILRDRAVVQVVSRDATVSTGRLERVGSDHVDLVRYPDDAAGRASDLLGRVTLPLQALAVVRRPAPTWG